MTSKLLTFSEKFQVICETIKDDIAYRISSRQVETPAKFDAVTYEVVDGKLMFSYCPDGKVVDSIWDNPYRQAGRPVSVLGKIFGAIYRKEDYEKFVAQFKNNVIVPNGTVSVVEGEEIKDAYLYENYVQGRGTSTLEKSCMRYDTHQHLLNIYVNNSDVVKLAKVDVDGKVGARALLWTADYEGEKVTVLDRKYCFNTEYETLLEDWGKKNVDFIRIHSRKIFFNTKTNEEEYLLFTIPFKIKDIGKTAYIDTFKWYNPTLNLLSNVYDGTAETFSLANPAFCGSRYPRRALPEEGKVYACLGGDFLEGRSELRRKEDCTIYQDYWFPKDAHVKCEECKRQIFQDEAVFVNDVYYCYNHTSVTIDGKLQPLCYTHSVIGDCERCLYYKKCSTCRIELHIDELTKSKDGYWVCEPCLKLKRFQNCGDCDNLYLDNNLSRINGNVVCGECLVTNYKACYNCGTYHPREEVSQVQVRGTRRHMCDSCITDCMCVECDTINTYIIVVNGESLCETCYYQVTANCVSCQVVTHKEDITQGVCNDCREAIS